MTISPFPGTVKRREVLDAARAYVPPPKRKPSATAMVWIGAVLILVSVGVILSVLFKLW